MKGPRFSGGAAARAGVVKPDHSRGELDGRAEEAIAEELNARGVKARGQAWHPTTVARVLARR